MKKAYLIFVRTVNGNWGAWTQWSTCSLSCGGGSRKRSRRCDNPPPSSGGTHCPGDDHQIDYCNKEECPGKCLFGKMRFNGSQRLCGTSYKFLTSSFIFMVFHYSYKLHSWMCPKYFSFTIHYYYICKKYTYIFSIFINSVVNLNTLFLISVHGNWAEWSDWGDCTVTCGGGQRRRFRTCTNPSPKHHGRPCIGNSQVTETCNTDRCAGKITG